MRGPPEIDRTDLKLKKVIAGGLDDNLKTK
jgi:hypothetical protein